MKIAVIGAGAMGSVMGGLLRAMLWMVKSLEGTFK